MIQYLQYKARSDAFSKSTLWEINASTHSLTWWKGNQFAIKTPQLYSIAAKLFSIPTFSASAKRLFSALGNIHTHKRNRLSNLHTEQLASIYFNERSWKTNEITIEDS